MADALADLVEQIEDDKVRGVCRELMRRCNAALGDERSAAFDAETPSLDWTKDELTREATKRGKEVTSHMTKSEILDLLK